MKDFHTWVSEMENSFEDTSYIKPREDVKSRDELTLRKDFADLNRPNWQSGDWIKWMSTFQGSGYLSEIIGIELSERWYFLKVTAEVEELQKTFVKDLRDKIESGWKPLDLLGDEDEN